MATRNSDFKILNWDRELIALPLDVTMNITYKRQADSDREWTPQGIDRRQAINKQGTKKLRIGTLDAGSLARTVGSV